MVVVVVLVAEEGEEEEEEEVVVVVVVVVVVDALALYQLIVSVRNIVLRLFYIKRKYQQSL